MRRVREWLIGALIMFCAATAANAQDQRDVGVVITTTTTAGVIWHVTDRVAIRPEVSFVTSNVDTGDSVSDIESSSGTFAVAALFTVRRWDDLSAYVSPRFSWLRATGTSTLSIGSITETIETSTDGFGIAGSFGVNYRLGDRFAVFGEAGVSFTDQSVETDSPLTLRRTDATSVGLRSALGVSFYF